MPPATLTAGKVAAAGISVAAAVTAVNMGMSNKDADPVLLAPPEAATHQVTGLMDAVCSGDFINVDIASICQRTNTGIICSRTGANIQHAVG